MPILANTLIAPIEEDVDRYMDMLANSPAHSVWTMNGDVYNVYSGLSDQAIPGLEDCDLTLITDSNSDVVYSCYSKQALTFTGAKRVVQVEVRCTVPGLAREAMKNVVQSGSILRTDISCTPAGRRMWERFIRQGDFHFYTADLSIDLRSRYGESNQNANQPEVFENMRHLTPGEEIWHANRKSGYVSVVYAMKENLL